VVAGLEAGRHAATAYSHGFDAIFTDIGRRKDGRAKQARNWEKCDRYQDEHGGSVSSRVAWMKAAPESVGENRQRGCRGKRDKEHEGRQKPHRDQGSKASGFERGVHREKEYAPTYPAGNHLSETGQPCRGHESKKCTTDGMSAAP
jgi:hypothetical protein